MNYSKVQNQIIRCYDGKEEVNYVTMLRGMGATTAIFEGCYRRLIGGQDNEMVTVVVDNPSVYLSKFEDFIKENDGDIFCSFENYPNYSKVIHSLNGNKVIFIKNNDLKDKIIAEGNWGGTIYVDNVFIDDTTLDLLSHICKTFCVVDSYEKVKLCK